MEQILGDGTTGFQVVGSVQIQGGSSTNRWKADKLSMRLKFTEQFGPTKLQSSLLGPDATDQLDTLVLDAVLNFGFHHPSTGQTGYAKFIQDQLVANLQNTQARIWFIEFGKVKTDRHHVFAAEAKRAGFDQCALTGMLFANKDAAQNAESQTTAEVPPKTAPADAKGTAMGVYSTSQFTGAFVGGLLGGWVHQHWGLHAVFLFGDYEQAKPLLDRTLEALRFAPEPDEGAPGGG